MKWLNQSTNQKNVLIVGMNDTIGAIAHIDNKLFSCLFYNLIICFLLCAFYTTLYFSANEIIFNLFGSYVYTKNLLSLSKTFHYYN